MLVEKFGKPVEHLPKPIEIIPKPIEIISKLIEIFPKTHEDNFPLAPKSPSSATPAPQNLSPNCNLHLAKMTPKKYQKSCLTDTF